jgi:hypothetical protein
MCCPIGTSSAPMSGKRGVRAVSLLAAVIFWWGTGHADQSGRFMDYLYVEANEGDSSGGHAAIRFGNETFHFQHESPGILRVRRHEAAVFDHAYAMVGNRSIRESRIAVSDETYALLRNAFAQALLVQDAQLEFRDALRSDVALFDLLLRQRRDPHGTPDVIPVALSGLGYFLPDAPSCTGVNSASKPVEGNDSSLSSPALLALRNQIHATYGEHSIADRISHAHAMLRQMELQAAPPPLPEISPDTLPRFSALFSTRYQDNLHALFALELLQAAPPLRAETLWTPEADTFRLEQSEAAVLKHVAAQLETDLVQLFDSPRTDWGLPFVLGMARLAAIESSLATGRLVLLDTFARNSPLGSRHDAALRPYLPMMEKEMQEIFLRKRREFFTGGSFREAEYATMERAGNLLLDIGHARATGSALREGPDSPFPSREARVCVPSPGQPDEATLARELSTAQDAEREYAAALDRIYSYDLFRRNCVTEIFTVINRTIARRAPGSDIASVSTAPFPVELQRTESEKRLGGFVDASHGLSFIPFVSALTVESSYAVVASRERPSYRTARLAEMKGREGALSVFLRESNTITSTVYRPGPGDSAFLFFTDDALLLRPLFGVSNLLVGFGEGLVGIVTMPVTGPARLISGTKGMLFSLPELFFVNIRKGSTAYVEKSAVYTR